MRASELTGSLLACWVAKAMKYENVRIGPIGCSYSVGHITHVFAPHERWDQGQLVLEKLLELGGVSFDKVGDAYFVTVAHKTNRFVHRRVFHEMGETALIALCRCYVVITHGAEVPEE